MIKTKEVCLDPIPIPKPEDPLPTPDDPIPDPDVPTPGPARAG